MFCLKTITLLTIIILTSLVYTISGKTCTLDYIPSNGRVKSFKYPHQVLHMGAKLPENSKIIYKCNNKFTITNDITINTCINGKWSETILPKCEIYCSKQALTSTTIGPTFCQYNNELEKRNCKNFVPPGTKVTLNCLNGYEYLENTNPIDRICENNGKWNLPLIECKPICGIKTNRKYPHKVPRRFYETTKNNVLPWHTSIYKYKLIDGITVPIKICGGTIISSDIVISAASCFWNSTTHKILDESNFFITVGGTYNSNYTNGYIQMIKIEKIYHMIDNESDKIYYGDIVLLKLLRSIVFRYYVRPICIDSNVKLNEIDSPSNFDGQTISYNAQHRMRIANLTTVDSSVCNDTRWDQFCAINYNRKKDMISQSDIGNGFVFSKTIKNQERFFLKGVLNNDNINNTNNDNEDNSNKIICGHKNYCYFTNVQIYYNFIQSVISKVDLLLKF